MIVKVHRTAAQCSKFFSHFSADIIDVLGNIASSVECLPASVIFISLLNCNWPFYSEVIIYILEITSSLNSNLVNFSFQAQALLNSTLSDLEVRLIKPISWKKNHISRQSSLMRLKKQWTEHFCRKRSAKFPTSFRSYKKGKNCTQSSFCSTAQ